MIGMMGFFGLVVQPLWKLGQFFYMPGRMHKVKKVRAGISLAVVCIAIAAVIFIPLPHSVNCTFEVGPRDAASVYVDVPGQLEELMVSEGEPVSEGQPLVQLDNPELEMRVARTEGQLRATRATLDSKIRERHANPQAGGEIRYLEEMEQTTEQQWREQERELARLSIAAPVAGVVIPAPPRQRREQEGMLPSWSGSPLDAKNIGATFAESDLICRVGDPNDLEALLVVDQADIDLVDEATRDGQEPEVELQLDAYAGRTLVSRVVEVARVEMKVAPDALSARAGGQLDTKTDASGRQRTISTSYQARVPLKDQGPLEGLICTGMRGRAKISTEWQSLGQRLHRYLARTFHFEL
jgi:putative peptide zinc metalloprotease protein